MTNCTAQNYRLAYLQSMEYVVNYALCSAFHSFIQIRRKASDACMGTRKIRKYDDGVCK